MREAGEEADRKGPLLLHLARPRLELAVREVSASLAHDVGKHRPIPPGGDRTRLAPQHGEDRLRGPYPGLAIVDVRIGLVTGDDVRMLDHGGIEVGVHVEGHPDGDVRRDLPDAREEFALSVLVLLGDHRAVEVEQDGVATPCHRSRRIASQMYSKAALRTGPLGGALAAMVGMTSAPAASATSMNPAVHDPVPR